ncbi:MAG: hypothetical protein WKF73_07355 [Nocardioidaceae bacterium]
MTTRAIEQDPVEVLVAVVRLLDRAAARVWAQAEQEGPRSSCHVLGVVICATSSPVLDLLPADVGVDVDAIRLGTTTILAAVTRRGAVDPHDVSPLAPARAVGRRRWDLRPCP